MRSSNTDISSVDESSVIISDDNATTTETGTDIGSKYDTDESLKSISFCEGEKVLAYHSCLIYEAKVLQADSSATSFFVHYRGWNKKWDEWVGKERLLKHNQENLEKQKTLEKEHPLEMITMSGRVFLKNPISPQNHNETKGKKRKWISEGTASYDKLFNIQVPTKLIKHLVSYCEYVTQMGKLVKLPCSPNIDNIMKLYLACQSNTDDRASDSAGEILNGLRCYFNKALPAMLLYKSELQQYEEATANNVSPSQIYGAEHLLRLFVKLPEILSRANVEDETLTVLQHRLQDFLKFLKKNQGSIFLSTYERPDGSCTTE